MPTTIRERASISWILIGTLLNFALGKAKFNGPDRTTHGVDLVEIRLGALLDGL